MNEIPKMKLMIITSYTCPPCKEFTKVGRETRKDTLIKQLLQTDEGKDIDILWHEVYSNPDDKKYYMRPDQARLYHLDNNILTSELVELDKPESFYTSKIGFFPNAVIIDEMGEIKASNLHVHTGDALDTLIEKINEIPKIRINIVTKDQKLTSSQIKQKNKNGQPKSKWIPLV
jgi:hypothetical protein